MYSPGFSKNLQKIENIAGDRIKKRILAYTGEKHMQENEIAIVPWNALGDILSH
jgi:hypothetical protein